MSSAMESTRPDRILPVAALLLWWVATVLWWALAFYPGGDVAPEWVTAVQTVCFGTDAAGLPAPYGWGALVAGPLGMLTILLVGWQEELLRAGRQVLRRPLGMLLGTLMLLGILGEAGWVGWRMTQILTAPQGFTLNTLPGELPEGYPRLGRPAPDFTLIDENGEPFSLASLRGRAVALTFAFGHCTTICTPLVKNLENGARRARVTDPAVVVITLDAWRDTPATLAGIRAKWGLGPEVTLLSGPVPEVNRTLDAYEAVRFRDPLTGTIDHTPLVFVIDPEGQLAYGFLSPSSRWVAEALERAAET